MKINLIKEDITKLNVEATVLPANIDLKEGKGVSEAIFKAAGKRKLTHACKEIGFCEPGGAVPTPGFKLPSSYIIHAVVPKWIDGQHYEYEMLSASYLSALSVADVMGCKTIAFPLLASGNNKFSKELALEIAINSIETYVPKSLKSVFLVLYTDKECKEANKYGYEIMNTSQYDQNIDIKEWMERGQKIAKEFVQEQVNTALSWLEVKENRDKIVDNGIKIVARMWKKYKNK